MIKNATIYKLAEPLAIAIGEIRPLIAELVSALGGLVTVAAKEGGA